MKGGLNPGKVVLRWSKWVKVGLNPGKVVLRWSKWVKVGLNPGTVVLRWSKWVKVGVNPGKVVLRECKRVKGGLNPGTGVLRWSKRVKGSLIWFKCGSKLIHTDPEYPCKTKYLPAHGLCRCTVYRLLTEPMSTRLLNSISSRICRQNTQFNMHTTTSKQQEGCTFKNSHPKCFITTNFDKFHREAFARGAQSR